MTRPRAKEFTSIKMAPLIQVNGLTISNMAMELKSGSMEPNMRAISRRDSKKATVHLFGPMVASMRVNLRTTILKALVIMSGSMAESTRDHGEITKCTAEAFSSGRTAVNTKASTLTTKKKGMVSSAGLMVDAIRANGKMESRTVGAPTGTRKVWKRMGHGSMARRLNGTIDI